MAGGEAVSFGVGSQRLRRPAEQFVQLDTAAVLGFVLCLVETGKQVAGLVELKQVGNQLAEGAAQLIDLVLKKVAVLHDNRGVVPFASFATPVPPPARSLGRIVFYLPERGTGYLRLEGTLEEFHFRKKNLAEGLEEVRKGQLVSFVLREGRGGYYADQIKPHQLA